MITNMSSGHITIEDADQHILILRIRMDIAILIRFQGLANVLR